MHIVWLWNSKKEGTLALFIAIVYLCGSAIASVPFPLIPRHRIQTRIGKLAFDIDALVQGAFAVHTGAGHDDAGGGVAGVVLALHAVE